MAAYQRDRDNDPTWRAMPDMIPLESGGHFLMRHSYAPGSYTIDVVATSQAKLLEALDKIDRYAIKLSIVPPCLC